MAIRKIYLLAAIVYLTQFTVTASSPKYQYIDDCKFYDRGLVFGNDNITFVCGPENNQDKVIIDSERFNCSNSLFFITNLWVGTVNFQKCQFTEVKTSFFREFINIHTFNISDLELKRLQMDAFVNAINLTNLIVAQSQLEEIRKLLFIQTKKIVHIDFSQNKINRVDALAFVGAKTLESLNLAHNSLSNLSAQVFKDTTNLIKLNLSNNKFTTFDANMFPNALIELDLSHNSLSALKDNSFDKLINLKQLILSFNPIVKLNFNIFVHLLNLEHLKLRHIDVSTIELGTFGQQHHLVTLDLSENQLKKLDFNLFAPVLQDLTTLELSGNQLTDLTGFRNSLFPKLTSLDIRDNKFSCSYLKYFMESVNWEKLRLTIDRKAINLQESNVRGIKCIQTNDQYEPPKIIDSNPTSAKLQSNTVCSNAQQNSNSDLYVVKVLVILIFFVMLTYLIVFVVINRDRITNQFHNIVVSYSKSRQSTADLTVDF